MRQTEAFDTYQRGEFDNYDFQYDFRSELSPSSHQTLSMTILEGFFEGGGGLTVVTCYLVD